MTRRHTRHHSFKGVILSQGPITTSESEGAPAPGADGAESARPTAPSEVTAAPFIIDPKTTDPNNATKH